jgi:hypothetical protein
MGCRPRPADPELQSQPAAIPAISKSTELQPQGQPSYVFVLSVVSSSQATLQGGTVISTEATHAFVSREVENPLLYLDFHPANAAP